MVRCSVGIAGLLLLTGCGAEQRAGNVAAMDINAAAEAAKGDIDTYAADALQPAVPAVPTVSQSPTTKLAAVPTPAAEEEATPETDDASDAVAVARSYNALIAAKRYGQAWRLWDDDGRASGMTEREFAASFARYARYRAETGAPGPVEAGAGQRFVEIPVRVIGTLADRSRPFALEGSLTLHRVADIDGATAEQRRWRIRDSSLRPRPRDGSESRAGATIAAYRCAGETRISVRFDNDADTATIRSDGREVAVLAGQRPASGIWYKGDGYELRGKGRSVDYTAPGHAAVACSAD